MGLQHKRGENMKLNRVAHMTHTKVRCEI